MTVWMKGERKKVRYCVTCSKALPVHTGPGRERHVCSDACWQKLSRRRQRLAALGIPEQPVLHLGRLQGSAAAYAGKIGVIITDPLRPQAPAGLRRPGAVCADDARPGRLASVHDGVGPGVRRVGRLAGDALEYITVVDYVMPDVHAQGHKRTSTGRRKWQEHHKPILWYQQRGRACHQRRAGSSDTIEVRVEGVPDMDWKTRKDEQSFAGFQQIVAKFTNRQDVIADPAWAGARRWLRASAWSGNAASASRCSMCAMTTVVSGWDY